MPRKPKTPCHHPGCSALCDGYYCEEHKALSAYGIASTEAIVTNMELILSGVKKEDLGEMAKQQMYLVMDQLKSQENLHNRMDKTEDSIEDLREELRLRSEEDDERDRRILEGEEKDREQDEIIEGQKKTDIEHEKALAVQEKKDKEHDATLFAHEKKIIEGNLKDEEQDKALAVLSEKGVARDEAIAQGEERDVRQDQQLDLQREKDIEHDEAIKGLGYRLDSSIEDIDHKIDQVASSKWMIYLALGMGIVSLILSVVHFFI